MSDSIRKCARCGTTLTLDAPEGLCPRCLIGLNFTAPTEEFGPGGTVVTGSKPEPPPIEQIAKLFPQFEILELLGRGGMGVVYKARHLRLDRLVALKVLAPDPENRRRFAERFEREAQALARLSHPNIVAVYDFGESDGLYYLAMEFVDGLNLRDLISGGKLTPQQALAIVPAICDALQYAHTSGIVHRDIKPENILLDKQGRVKIADFGIAKILGAEPRAALTGEQQAIGTPHYMAPEQIEKPAEVDHRADIYSLGVVFYEMLTGELPLGKFALPSKKVQVDVRLDDVVLHALEKEPARRYQRVEQVKTDVQNIAAGVSAAGAASSTPAAASPSLRTTSDKTILPAFLLAFFLGVFGAHRFYVGKIGTAILQLCTFGACGIWTTVDWILLLCKAFTDKEGRRLTEWIDPDGDTRPRTAGPPPGASGATATMAAQEPVNPYSKVKPAAIGLIVAASLKMLSGLGAGAALIGMGPLLSVLGFNEGDFILSDFESRMGSAGSFFTLIPSIFLLIGAMKMLRMESYRWAIAAAIISIALPPLHIVGIPLGVWALFVLTQRGVRDAFGLASPATGGGRRVTSGAVGAAAVIALLVLVIGVGTAIGVSAVTAKTGDPVEQPFSFTAPLAENGRLSVGNVNGRIQITLGTNAAVVVNGVKRASSRELVDGVNTDVNSDSNHVVIRTRHPRKRFFGGWNNNLKVDYKIEVPQGTRLDKIENVNGQILIDGIHANIAASTVNGALDVKGARNDVQLSTVNGKITAIVVENPADQSISLETVNGSVSITLPAQASVQVKGETVNGSISSDFTDLQVKKDGAVGRDMTGTVGDGRAKLKFKTVNGGVSIKRAETAP